MKSKRGLCVAALAMLAALTLATAVTAAEPPSVMILVDGSGSMWGAIDGSRQNKLTVVRDGVRGALAKMSPQSRVGLGGFGHRRGDCGDVEAILPPERLDVERIMAPLGPYNPRGRGPLTLALREMAKSLAGLQGQRSIVLVHDEADNCQADLCAVAGELKTAGITAHVVGVGLKPADVAKMSCLAQTTGGRMLIASTADQVAPALDEVLRIAGLDGSASEPRQTVQTTTQRSTASLAAEGPPGLYLRALLAPKTEPVSWAVRWTVYAEADPGRVLFNAVAANPMVSLPAGRYVVEARDGVASGTLTVDVRADAPTVAGVSLNAGTLAVKLIPQRAGAPTGDAFISISSMGEADAKKDQGAGLLVAFFKGSEGAATLPAGRYMVRVDQGLVRAERAVVVPPASQGRIDIPLTGARVIVSALGGGTQAASELPVFSVVEDDPDAPRGRREIARSAARQAEFVLPAGTYYVMARLGSVEARERLALAPGDTIRRTLTLAAGRLTLATRLGGGTMPAASDPISYRIERLDGPPGDVVTTSRAAPTLQLAAGRYRVEGRYGLTNARSVREVEIKAGQTQQLTLEHQAGVLKLRLTGLVAISDVFWDVRDETGRNVWTTGQSEPTMILQAGRYVVRAETRDKRYDRQVDLRGGETRLLELTAD